MAERDRSPERLNALTDGVIAITMTLLCLDIRLPHPAEGLGNAELLASIRATLPNLAAYALSFVVIAQFWRIHHRRFASLRHVDAGVFWLNVLFLLLTGVIPFVTAMLAENANAVGTAAYAAVMASASLALAGVSIYANARGFVEGAEGGTPMRWRVLRSLTVSGVFLVSIPVAFWNADIAKYLWLLLIPANFALARAAPAGKSNA